MNETVRKKRGKTVHIGVGILVFLLAFGAGVASKAAFGPAWAKE